jgi:ureidoacrylate peracid hydrolase
MRSQMHRVTLTLLLPENLIILATETTEVWLWRNTMTSKEYETRTAGATYLPKDEVNLAFPRERTALLVIDPVNDFLSEGGAGWEMTKNTVKMNDVIGHLKQAIEGARSHGIPVLFGPMAYTEEDYVEGHVHKRSGINRLMFEKKMFLAGSWGADFYPELQPHEEDTVLLPHKSCDVFTTDLPEAPLPE